MKIPKILISVLNWNTSENTLACVQSILDLVDVSNYDAELIVVDNGSTIEELNHLQANIDSTKVRLIRESINLGFAGGHNIAIRAALAENADYVWLVNSDAVVDEGALSAMVKVMEGDSKCGAVSPLILALENASVIDFCGARHDWGRLESITCVSVNDAVSMEATYPNDMWLMGAAIMLRTDALRQIGLLDEGLFAYYEDNDICARLSSAGWTSRMVFDAVVRHSHPESRMHDKKPYYFYLMARNSFKFWFKHTPTAHRRFLRLKLIDRAFLVANRLYFLGLEEKTSACLLGIYDSQLGKKGVWNLQRRTPIIMRLIRTVLWRNHRRHLRV